MIRPFTLLAAALAAGSGYYLYQAKHHTKLLDDKIAAVEHKTAEAEARIAVLRAEWALENSPSRLADLAARYLLLTPMQPSQAVSMADLASRLPPPATPDANPPVVAEPDLAVVAGLQEPALYASVSYFLPTERERRAPVLPLAVASVPAAVSDAPHSSPAPAERSLPVADAATPAAALPPPAPPERVAAPATPALVARTSRPAAPAPAALAETAARETLAPKAMVRPVTLEAARERPPLARPHAASVLTSALGGAYPNLPPPAPLAGSH